MKERNQAMIALLAVCAALAAAPASANERRFTYTYESATLPKGVQELEPWLTVKAGRTSFYSRFDYRVEYEAGLSDRLQTSLYLNWHQASMADENDPSRRVRESEFDGVSSEWKYKVWDPVADPVGLALYQEYTFQSDEFGWESKLILDKRIGKTLIAYNAVVEPEWEFGPGHSDASWNLENDLGVSRFITPALSLGFELVNENEKRRIGAGWTDSTLWAGPAAGYAGKSWWVAATLLRQLPALKRSPDAPQDSLVLDEHEKFNFRVIGALRF